MTDSPTNAVGRLIYEQGHLKVTPRTGWAYAGVTNPESVAEHSHRAAIIAYVLAAIEGANPDRAAAMALWHDSQETRITDIAYVGRRYLTTASNEHVTDDQTTDLPAVLRDRLRNLIGDFEGQTSQEAVLARDADKLECLAQAREYQATGRGDTQDWIKSSAAALRSGTAQRLADVLMSMHPHEWWRHVLAQGEE